MQKNQKNVLFIIVLSFIVVILSTGCDVIKSDLDRAKEANNNLDYVLAREKANAYLLSNPDSRPAHWELLRSMVNEGNVQAIKRYFEQKNRFLNDRTVDLGQACYDKATSLHTANNYIDAIEFFKIACFYYPQLNDRARKDSYLYGKNLYEVRNNVTGMMAYLDFSASLGNLDVGTYYAKVGKTKEQYSEKVMFLERAARLDDRYRAELLQIHRQQMFAELERAINSSEKVWAQTVMTAEKHLTPDELLEYALTYYTKHYGELHPFAINPNDKWGHLATVPDKKKVYYISNGDFVMKDDVWNRDINCRKYISKPGWTFFEGGKNLKVFVKSDKPVKGFYWIG